MEELNHEKRRLMRYWPLFALTLVAVLAALALVSNMERNFYAWMHYFMGFFFCQFAMLKLFHPADFAEGFQMYDLIAKKFPPYAYIYPLIELALGLAYLAFVHHTLTNLVTIGVMGMSAIGVIKALNRGLDVRCACMGSVLDVPLSTVTLAEDILMGLMACVMLFAPY